MNRNNPGSRQSRGNQYMLGKVWDMLMSPGNADPPATSFQHLPHLPTKEPSQLPSPFHSNL